MYKQVLMWTLWPSFLVAGIAEGILFSLIDPAEVTVFGELFHGSAMAVYTAGFFVLWALMALSSFLSLAIQPHFFERQRENQATRLSNN